MLVGCGARSGATTSMRRELVGATPAAENCTLRDPAPLVNDSPVNTARPEESVTAVGVERVAPALAARTVTPLSADVLPTLSTSRTMGAGEIVTPASMLAGTSRSTDSPVGSPPSSVSAVVPVVAMPLALKVSVRAPAGPLTVSPEKTARPCALVVAVVPDTRVVPTPPVTATLTSRPAADAALPSASSSCAATPLGPPAIPLRSRAGVPR
jgi:hypothetical protein